MHNCAVDSSILYILLYFRREEARKKELEDLQRQQELLRAQIDGVPVSVPCVNHCFHPA